MEEIAGFYVAFTESLCTLTFSLPKTIEFFFNVSKAVVKTVGVQINAIQFILFEVDIRMSEIRIIA